MIWAAIVALSLWRGKNMQLKILGVGNSPLLSIKVKTLDDANLLLNVSALARKLGVHRSTFLS
ncbi:hypothetical protein ACJEPZ_27700, partial [Klebsiella pneumoniae]|uniref:hypothetical protein n=2 Tax=Klebsiella/Raoultella group TaxID=2890311 RepID=UPI0038721140